MRECPQNAEGQDLKETISQSIFYLKENVFLGQVSIDKRQERYVLMNYFIKYTFLE